MIHRCQHLCFALEASQAAGILRENVRQNLDGDLAIQLGVGCPPDFAHAALAELGCDAIAGDGLWRAHGVAVFGILSLSAILDGLRATVDERRFRKLDGAGRPWRPMEGNPFRASAQISGQCVSCVQAELRSALMAVTAVAAATVVEDKTI